MKHNRKDELSRANIENLLKALSALYLLNVYYRDESFYQTSLTRGNTDFNVSLGTNIFSIKMSNQPHTNQVNRENSSGADQDNVDSVYLLCFPMTSIQRVRQLEKEAWQKRNNALTSSREFLDFANSGEQLRDSTNIFSIIHKIGLWAYKKKILAIPTKTEQLNAIFSSSEYIKYTRNNARNLEKIDREDVEALCNHVGHWNYMQQIMQYERVLHKKYFESRLEIVLNKGQAILAQEDTANDA